MPEEIAWRLRGLTQGGSDAIATPTTPAAAERGKEET